MLLYPLAKWAAGHNNAGSLASVEATVPTNDIAFDAPKMVGNYNPGIFRVKFNARVSVVGYEYIEWLFNTMTRVQLSYIRSTFCSGGWSGLMTIATRTLYSTYGNFNATMVVVPPTATQNIGIMLSEGIQVAGYRDMLIKFYHMKGI